MKKRIYTGKILRFLGILVLGFAVLIGGLRILESTVFKKDQSQDEPLKRKTITVDGVDYFPRQDITVMLVMGIDQTGPVTDSGSYRNPGAADLVALLIFDEKTRECNVLCLNRDTMLEMPVLGIGGKQAGTAYGQLALAHTYGGGLEDSCENTVETVSNFLNKIRIDYYVAVNMDAIPLVNDAVGGVTVQVEDDFSAVDPTITKGEVTLRGQQAVHYVQTRKGVGDQLNVSRLERQQAYVRGLVGKMQEAAQEDTSFVSTLYQQLSPYLVSNCPVKTMNGFVTSSDPYTLGQIVTPEGSNVLGEQYYEFYADEEKLEELTLRLFYRPK